MSMQGQLLVKKKMAESLGDFVVVLGGVLGLAKWVERQSSNYAGDRYFLGGLPLLEIVVSLADDSELIDYDFWISLEASDVECGDESLLRDSASQIARNLASGGYEVFQPHDMSRQKTGGLIYRLNSDSLISIDLI